MHILFIQYLKQRMNWHPDDDFLEMLMSGKGDEYLDRQIDKLRREIGEKEFQEFADEYFKNEGEHNIYAPKPAITAPQPSPNNTPPEPGQQKKYLQEDPEQAEQILSLTQPPIQQQQNLQEILQLEEGTTNNQQGLVQIKRELLPAVENQPQSRYKITYNNGDIYQGQIEDEAKSGWGTYTYSNGEKYTGCFIEDEIHGYGRYYFLSGAEYEGDWSSGMKHGIGILKFANGDEYNGGFCRDEFHGNGTYQHRDGSVFRGRWRNGKKNGPGKYEGADGHLQIGTWNDDRFEV